MDAGIYKQKRHGKQPQQSGYKGTEKLATANKEISWLHTLESLWDALNEMDGRSIVLQDGDHPTRKV